MRWEPGKVGRSESCVKTPCLDGVQLPIPAVRGWWPSAAWCHQWHDGHGRHDGHGLQDSLRRLDGAEAIRGAAATSEVRDCKRENIRREGDNHYWPAASADGSPAADRLTRMLKASQAKPLKGMRDIAIGLSLHWAIMECTLLCWTWENNCGYVFTVHVWFCLRSVWVVDSHMSTKLLQQMT